MERQDRNTITRNLTALIKQTRLDSGLEAALIERGVLTEEMVARLATADPTEHKRNLYTKLQTRGPTAFSSLVAALLETGQAGAAGLLDPALQQQQSKVWNPPNYQAGRDGRVLPPVLPATTTPLQVRVNRTAGAAGPPDTHPAYSMASEPRGLMLIINNEDFDNDILPRRNGSLVDTNNLDILFGELGFRVTIRRNLGFYDMNTEIQKFAGKVDEAELDMVVVAVLSHGRHGLVSACDGRELETEWVMRQFNNHGCPAMRGKPKFFIFQACRGDEADYGAPATLNLMEQRTGADAKVVAAPAEQPQEFRVLSWEDILVAYSTLPGYVANRDLYRGTWFIESLCSVFMEFAVDRDLRDMLDMVAERLNKYESETGTKQSFAYEVRHFYKKLYFNPKPK